MVIEMKTLACRGALRGRTLGQRHFGELSIALSKAADGEPAFLDFGGVKTVNGSWLNACLAQLLRWSADQKNEVVPILVRFPEEDEDELQLVAEVNEQCYQLADSTEVPPRSVRLMGALPEHLRETLNEVIRLGEATGASLSKEVGDESIGPTAWNNRLRDLYSIRLVGRRTDGRRQFFRSIAAEVKFDG